jgi:hypothetical protein
VKKGESVMKNVLGIVLVAAIMVFASSAKAQEFRVKADVPFDFSIDKQVYHAGEYDIQKLNTTLLLVDSGNGSARTIVKPLMCTSQKPASSTKLVFHRVGQTYFLYQIWIEGRTYGREFPTPKMETELLAHNGAKPEDVIVAAIIEK